MTKKSYSREVEAAIKACPQEARALESAKAELAKLETEKDKAQAALARLRADGRNYRTERRIVHGVELEVQVRTDADEIALLTSHLERLDHKIRHQSHQVTAATRRLSSAVATKLESIQADLRKRTAEVIEAVTRICGDGEALEDSMRAAGLDPDSVYAVRYSELQGLRVDQNWTRGRSILSTLKEVA